MAQTGNANCQIHVAAGSAVALLVSSGPASVVVPNVVGLREGSAVAALREAGLTSTVTRVESGTVPKGKVISQNPAAGVRVAAGSAVALLVSRGEGGGGGE